MVAAVILCQGDAVEDSFNNGRRAVDQGRLTSVGLPTLMETTNRLAVRLVGG